MSSKLVWGNQKFFSPLKRKFFLLLTQGTFSFLILLRNYYIRELVPKKPTVLCLGQPLEMLKTEIHVLLQGLHLHLGVSHPMRVPSLLTLLC